MNNNNNLNISIISNKNVVLLLTYLLAIITTLNNSMVQAKSVNLNATEFMHNAPAINGSEPIISATNNANDEPSNGNNDSLHNEFNYGKAKMIHSHLDYLNQDLFDSNDKESIHKYLRSWMKYHILSQQLPTTKPNNTKQQHQHFYTNFNQYGIDNSALSVYLSFAVDRLNRHHSHHYFQFRHYFHNWIRQEPQTVIASSEIVPCRHHFDGTYLCPLNTRPLCTVNGTIYCVAPMNSTQPCRNIDTSPRRSTYPLHNKLQCVKSMVPCIVSTANVDGSGFINRGSVVKCQADKDMWMEHVVMPCLTKIVIRDEFETEGAFGRRTTLMQVSGTFAMVAAVPKWARTYCAPIIADFVPFDN